MSGKKRKNHDEPVEPDLPITPMLDMSFQLMAFFIFTFRPAPTEGQIAMSLPKEEGGTATAASMFDDKSEKPVTYIVRVEPAPNGTIASMSILEKDAADTKPMSVGADPANLQKELKKRFDELKGKPGKLTLEIDDGLIQEYVVRLLDVAINVGFTDVAPVPLDPKKR